MCDFVSKFVKKVFNGFWRYKIYVVTGWGINRTVVRSGNNGWKRYLVKRTSEDSDRED